MPSEEDLKNSIIELYQSVKIRKQSDTKKIDKEYLEQEKSSLQSLSSQSLIDYIKVHLNLLINLKVSDKLSRLKNNPMEFISLYGSELPANDYEKLLRRYEADIRNYIKIVNVLKIHIEELNQKQEILQNQVEQMQKDSIDLIPTTQSIEYKKKIEELTALIKTYEKRDLQIPLLEKKIKKQKIELDKLDLYYKKQIKTFTKKIEDYEKGIYLNNNCNNCNN
jgi:FtsZ-binding cell division protein ZapB